MAQIPPRGSGRGPIQSRVIEDLGRKIVYGTVLSGTVLRLEDLVAEYGVSRSAVRDAITVLQSMGLVEAKRRVGITVTDVDTWAEFTPEMVHWRLEGPQAAHFVAEIALLRATVEPLAAGRTAAFHPEVGTQLRDLAQEVRVAGNQNNTSRLVNADLAFHRLTLRNCENTFVAELEPTLLQVITIRGECPDPQEPLAAATIALYRVVAEAVCEGDEQAASCAMLPLVERSNRAALDALSRRPPLTQVTPT